VDTEEDGEREGVDKEAVLACAFSRKLRKSMSKSGSKSYSISLSLSLSERDREDREDEDREGSVDREEDGEIESLD
jgi:hypothetical protein